MKALGGHTRLGALYLWNTENMLSMSSYLSYHIWQVLCDIFHVIVLDVGLHSFHDCPL